MQRQREKLVVAIVRPILLAVGFVVKLIYAVLFAWWVHPWVQRKGNAKLIGEIQAQLAFLVLQDSANMKAIRADWPTVELSWENVLLTIVRWHDEISVMVAPRSAPGKAYLLGHVIAAMENRHLSDRYAVNDLSDAAELLRPRLEALNAALSPREWVSLEQRL